MPTVIKTTLSRKGHAKRIVQGATPQEKKAAKGPTYIAGEYARSIHFFEALEYTNGFGDVSKSNVMQRLIFSALLSNDEALMDKLLDVSLSSIGQYERDTKWESLSLEKKVRELKGEEGMRPVGKRYEVELQQLSQWQGDEDEVYMRDLVGVYRSLPQSKREVGWQVTTKCKKVGAATDKALQYISFNILLHQVLHEGLKVTRTLISHIIEKSVDLPFLTALLLHTAESVKGEEWPAFMTSATKKGLLEFVSYMAQCGTMPNQRDRTEILTELVLRSNDTTAIGPDEIARPGDRARNVRILLAEKMNDLGDVKEAGRMRSIRIPQGEERERFEEEKRKKQERQEAEERRKGKKGDDLIDLDCIDFDEE